MKKILIVMCTLITCHAFADKEKPVKSEVKKVTVFTQGAQVFRTAGITLSPGVTNLVFSGISQYINPQSIQAGGKGAFIILDLKHEIKYPEPPVTGEIKLPKEILNRIKAVEDSLTESDFKKADLAERKNALLLEKNMIVKNKLAQGEGKSDSLQMLMQAMEFFRTRLADINSRLGKLNREELALNKVHERLTTKMNELKAYRNSEDPEKHYEPLHQVIVTVSADEAVTGNLDISYMVTQAGWIPSYDLRSATTTAPVQLTYKANVYQNTGEEWNEVNLKLSTSNPNRNNVKPTLPVWYVNYYTQKPELTIRGARPQSNLNLGTFSMQDATTDDKKVKELPIAQSAANYSQLIETMTNVEFEIKLPYSIPSDGAGHIVAVKNGELPATYCHYLVPKLESDAFLLAKVTGWETLNLLPGQANIFYEGTYVGNTVLNPSVINDTLELALGRDNGITVTRTRLPDKDKSKLLGTDITKTVVYELKMKNNKSKVINLIVEDQIPVSQNKEIKVELKDDGKAKYNPDTGLLKWDFALEPKSYKSLKFTYAITSNKDMPLSMY